MSLVLGPIHYLMYQKICYQDQLTEAILANDSILKNQIDTKQPPVKVGDLVELIDQSNIHGWLSSRIDIVEARLAAAIKFVPSSLHTVYEMGQKASKEGDFSSLKDLFQSLNPFLLDGMPCDRGLSANVEGDCLYLIEGSNQHPCFDLEYPLDICPEDSLSKTCSGNHDHEHHDNFELHPLTKMPSNSQKITPFAQFRYAFLSGYFHKSPYQVELIDGKNFKISPK